MLFPTQDYKEGLVKRMRILSEEVEGTGVPGPFHHMPLSLQAAFRAELAQLRALLLVLSAQQR